MFLAYALLEMPGILTLLPITSFFPPPIRSAKNMQKVTLIQPIYHLRYSYAINRPLSWKQKSRIFDPRSAISNLQSKIPNPLFVSFSFFFAKRIPSLIHIHPPQSLLASSSLPLPLYLLLFTSYFYLLTPYFLLLPSSFFLLPHNSFLLPTNPSFLLPVLYSPFSALFPQMVQSPHDRPV